MLTGVLEKGPPDVTSKNHPCNDREAISRPVERFLGHAVLIRRADAFFTGMALHDIDLQMGTTGMTSLCHQLFFFWPSHRLHPPLITEERLCRQSGAGNHQSQPRLNRRCPPFAGGRTPGSLIEKPGFDFNLTPAPQIRHQVRIHPALLLR